MSSSNSIEDARRLGDFGYRRVTGVYLGTQGECVFASDPNGSPSRPPLLIGGDCVLGERPRLEETITAKLMAVPGLLTLRTAVEPRSRKFKPDMVQGWNGEPGALVVSAKRVYQLFPSSYITGEGISRGHFLLHEVSGESIRFVGNILHFDNLDNLLRLELWETPGVSYQVGRKRIFVPQKWGGAVIIEGTNPGGLMTKVLDVINKTAREREIPIWRKNRI